MRFHPLPQIPHWKQVRRKLTRLSEHLAHVPRERGVVLDEQHIQLLFRDRHTMYCALDNMAFLATSGKAKCGASRLLGACSGARRDVDKLAWRALPVACVFAFPPIWI